MGRPESKKNSPEGNPADIVSRYFKEAGQRPLLSSLEEKKLLIQVSDGKKAKEKLEGDDSQLSLDYKEKLEKQVEKGDKARTILIESNLRLVISIAKNYQRRGLEFSDLIDEGNIGLMRAIDKYDLEKTTEEGKPHRLSTYAVWWIRQRILRALGEQGRTIRLPPHVIEDVNRISKEKERLFRELDKEPTAGEIAKELGREEKEIEERLSQAGPILSLDREIFEEEELRIVDLIVDENALTSLEGERGVLVDDVMESFECLLPKEREVLKLRFGIRDGIPRTLEKTGEELGVTRERIRQIEARAIRKLRQRYHRQKRRKILTRRGKRE